MKFLILLLFTLPFPTAYVGEMFFPWSYSRSSMRVSIWRDQVSHPSKARIDGMDLNILFQGDAEL